MKLQIAAAVFAFLAAGSQLFRLLRLGDDERHKRGRLLAATVLMTVAGVSGAASAVLRANETQAGGAEDYQDCIEEQEAGGEPSGGLSDMARAYCEEHRSCDHLDGTRDLPDRLLSPEDWCDTAGAGG